MTRRRVVSAILVFGLLGVYGIGQLGTFAHLLNKAHRVCAQHGDLVHAPDPSDSSIASQGVHLSPAPTTRAQPASHSHTCLFSFNCRSTVRPVPDPAIGAAALMAEFEPVLHSRVSGSPLSPLHYAPKHSPPATA